jgi:glycosyltransferase involved in cell wall biosynthesis
MKIGLLSTAFPQRCGIAKYSEFLAGELRRTGSVSAVTLLAEYPATRRSCDLHTVLPTFRREDDFASQIMSRVSEGNFDLVHIQHEYGIFGADGRFPELLRRLKIAGVPIVVTLHTVHTKTSINCGCTDSAMTRSFRRIDVESYQVEISKLAGRVVVHHESAMRRVLLRQGCEPARVVAIPHGTPVIPVVDPVEAKRALGIEANAKLMVAYGYITRSKNFHVLLEAFRRLRTKVPQAKLWLGGHTKSESPDGAKYIARCRKIIRDAQLEQDVIFSPGFVEEAALSLLLGAAEVCCFVYDEDTRSASGAMHLALGFGGAIVAARIPKFEEIGDVADELLVNPRSSGDLSRLLARLLTDDTFRNNARRALGKYGARTAWPRVAQTHLAVYRSVLQKSQPMLGAAGLR